jgi:hypothetical protein
MPGLDRTGPGGKGSRTGRQLGKCNPNMETLPEPGTGMGRGAGQAAGRAAKYGSGRGKGQGWRHQSGRC